MLNSYFNLLAITARPCIFKQLTRKWLVNLCDSKFMGSKVEKVMIGLNAAMLKRYIRYLTSLCTASRIAEQNIIFKFHYAI